MNDKLSALISTGNLGDNIIEKKSFHFGLQKEINYFAADAGTADAGPTFLGADMPHNPIEWETHDLELLLLASRERGVPMIVGSCGTTGTNRGVNLYADIVRSLAEKHRLESFKMGLIYSQITKSELLERLHKTRIEPLGAEKNLDEETINMTNNVTVSMGVEQIIYALENNCDVILAGRACDDAVIAAYPIFKGFPRGISLHMGKAAECASLVCWPQMIKESIIATVTEGYFEIEPMHPDQRATPHSLAAHSMYERTSPFYQGVPGGLLDMKNSKFIPVNDRITRVSESRFVPSADGSYKVKLEGAGCLGNRVYQIVGVRDCNAIKHIDNTLEQTFLKVDEIMAPKKRGRDFELYFHIFGKNAILKNLEPLSDNDSHEICIVIEAISSSLDLATTVIKCAKYRLFYMSYPGQKNSSGGAVALLVDEPLYPKNKCYQWTIDHLLPLSDPLDDKIFQYKFEIVGGS